MAFTSKCANPLKLFHLCSEVDPRQLQQYGLCTQQFPVPAYVGSWKTLKDLEKEDLPAIKTCIHPRRMQ